MFFDGFQIPFSEQLTVYCFYEVNQATLRLCIPNLIDTGSPQMLAISPIDLVVS